MSLVLYTFVLNCCNAFWWKCPCLSPRGPQYLSLHGNVTLHFLLLGQRTIDIIVPVAWFICPVRLLSFHTALPIRQMHRIVLLPTPRFYTLFYSQMDLRLCGIRPAQTLLKAWGVRHDYLVLFLRPSASCIFATKSEITLLLKIFHPSLISA